MVQLTEEQRRRGETCGRRRYTVNRQRNITNRLVAKMDVEEQIQNDIYGALAEVFVADLLNVPWSGGVDSPDNIADAGEDIEVKSSRYRTAHLIVRPRSHRANPTEYIKSHRYVLVTYDTNSLDFTFAGWITGEEVMQDKSWKKDYWWIPQSELNKEIPHA